MHVKDNSMHFRFIALSRKGSKRLSVAFSLWLDANNLSLNIEKTNYIIFHSSTNAAIKIGKKLIKRVKVL